MLKLLKINKFTNVNIVRKLQHSSVQPSEDGFIRDLRGSKTREVISENFVLKNKKFRLEIADDNDLSMLVEFLNEAVIQRIGMAKALGMTLEDVNPLTVHLVENALKHRLSPLLFDEDKLVGAYAVSVFDENTLPKAFPFDMKIRQTGKHQFKIKDDYSNEVNNGPFDNRNANIIAAYMNAFYSECGNMLPLDCRCMAYGEIVGVHPKYSGYDMMNHICDFVEKFAPIRYNADYFGAVSVSGPSIHVSEKRNRTLIAELPYKQFKVNGKSPFDGMDEDDVLAACFKIKKLEKSANNYCQTA